MGTTAGRRQQQQLVVVIRRQPSSTYVCNLRRATEFCKVCTLNSIFHVDRKSGLDSAKSRCRAAQTSIIPWRLLLSTTTQIKTRSHNFYCKMLLFKRETQSSNKSVKRISGIHKSKVKVPNLKTIPSDFESINS